MESDYRKKLSLEANLNTLQLTCSYFRCAVLTGEHNWNDGTRYRGSNGVKLIRIYNILN